jgi:hypothetical protein
LPAPVSPSSSTRTTFHLCPADRVAVTAGVMAALEHEEFFGLEFVGNPFQDEPDPETD